MGELIEKLGIDGKVLIAQIINFGILLIVLYKLLYKPILDVLERRKKTIEKSLKDAADISKRMEHAEVEIGMKLTEAKREASRILEESRKAAEEERQKRKEETAKEIQDMREKVRAEIEEEKRGIINEARQEIGSLVVELSEKVIRKNLDKNEEEAIAADITDAIAGKGKGK